MTTDRADVSPHRRRHEVLRRVQIGQHRRRVGYWCGLAAGPFESPVSGAVRPRVHLMGGELELELTCRIPLTDRPEFREPLLRHVVQAPGDLRERSTAV